MLVLDVHDELQRAAPESGLTSRRSAAAAAAALPTSENYARTNETF